MEFSESLRVSIETYPENAGLAQMGREELKTTNLQYPALIGHSNFEGDHWEFLKACMDKMGLRFEGATALKRIADVYLQKVRSLNPKQRTLTVCSREKELHGVFKQVLSSLDWDKYGHYKYYAEMHIELDTKDGGHGDLIESLMAEIFDAETLEFYYQARIEFITALLNAKRTAVNRPEHDLSKDEITAFKVFYLSLPKEARNRIYELFYEKIFQKAPALQDLFKHLKQQEERLGAMMYFIVTNLEHWDIVIAELHQLGAFHKPFGLDFTAFLLVGETLVESAAEVGGEAVLPYAGTLTKIYNITSLTIQEGMALAV